MRTTRIAALALTGIWLALASGGLALTAAPARAQDKPRYGGVLNWFDYGDPGRLDVHAESPLVVQQATAGVYSGLLHYDPDDPTKIAGTARPTRSTCARVSGGTTVSPSPPPT